MARPKLPIDAKIADILPSLTDKLKYVLGVFQSAHEFRKAHGSAFVRIGITGRGKVPNYRIEPDLELMGMLEDLSQGGEAAAKHYTAFDGRNHKQLDWGMEELKNEHWSRGSMSYADVQALVGELRGIRLNGNGHRT